MFGYRASFIVLLDSLRAKDHEVWEYTPLTALMGSQWSVMTIGSLMSKDAATSSMRRLGYVQVPTRTM